VRRNLILDQFAQTFMNTGTPRMNPERCRQLFDLMVRERQGA